MNSQPLTVGVRVDRKRRQYVTTFLRALGFAETDEEILALFDGAEVIANTLEKDPAADRDEALLDLYRKLRPGELTTVESAATASAQMSVASPVSPPVFVETIRSQAGRLPGRTSPTVQRRMVPSLPPATGRWPSGAHATLSERPVKPARARRYVRQLPPLVAC